MKNSGREFTNLAKIQVDDIENEHLCYNILQIDNDNILGSLIQDSYYFDDLKQGVTKLYPVSAISDWIVYTEKYEIKPSDSYILDEI